MKLPPINFTTKGNEVANNHNMLFSISAPHKHDEINYRIIVKSSIEPLLSVSMIDAYSIVQIMILYSIGDEREVYLNLIPSILSEEQANGIIDNIKKDFTKYVKTDE